MDGDAVETTGKIKDKLIEKKQDWARQGRLLTGAPLTAPITIRSVIACRPDSAW